MDQDTDEKQVLLKAKKRIQDIIEKIENHYSSLQTEQKTRSIIRVTNEVLSLDQS